MSDIFEYKCPNCGGALQFNAGAQTVKCPYCGCEFDPVAVSAYDDELNKPQADDIKWEDTASREWEAGETENMKVYVCNSCGGEIVADENTAATSCPYCSNPVVFKGNLAGDLKPDYVIPFRLDKKAAKECYYKHLEGKKFLPKQFKDANHIDEIKGIYVPFWLYDCGVQGDVRFRATDIRSWEDRDNIYTETKHFMVRRAGTMNFEKVPVDGSAAIDDQLMQSIEPFDFRDAVDFKTAYLAGYLADKYSVGSEESIRIANERIKRSAEEALRSTVRGYGSVVTEASSIVNTSGKSSYALYPVWILNTTYEGKRYIFAANGQTGKTVGDLPMSNSAYWANFAKVGGIGFAITMVLYALSNFI